MVAKSAPQIEKLVLPLIAFLLILVIVNTLFNWIKTKPWKRIKIDIQEVTEENSHPNLTEAGNDENIEQNLKMKLV